MIYVAIDPSGSFLEGKGHTGISVMEDDNWGGLLTFNFDAKKYTSRYDYWKAIINTVLRFATLYKDEGVKIAIETFTVRSNGFLVGKMPETSLLIGALIYELEAREIEYIFQSPSQAKSRFKDELLLKYIPVLEKKGDRFYLKGKMINDHIRDSLRHLLFLKKYGG